MRRLALVAALLLPATQVDADPAAWVVSRDGAQRIWLLGSVHYLRASDYPLPSLVDELYAGADELVMELDLDDLDSADTARQFSSVAGLPAERSLESMIGSELYARLAAKCRELGVPASSFDKLAPWFVALNLLALGLADAGFSPQYGLEQHLVASAAADGKPIIGLETLETQIAALSGLSDRDQRALLAQTLDEIDRSASEIEKLVEAWRAGDEDVLAAALDGDLGQFPGLYAQIVTERNEHWADELAELAAGGKRYLVVVGALHLVGRASVIELLRARGMEVDRIDARDLP